MHHNPLNFTTNYEIRPYFIKTQSIDFSLYFTTVREQLNGEIRQWSCVKG